MFWDATYILVLLGALLCAAASANIRSTYNRFGQVASARGYTAAAVAEMILRGADIYDVRLESVSGTLSDHYAPNEKVLRLSAPHSTSVADIGVAAHECGHAIQHHTGYLPLHLRSLTVPIAKIGSTFYWPLILLGLILGYTGLARIGVLLFLFVVLFQLLTLPVEFNASRRAQRILAERNILVGEELTGAEKVLRAAALTYVASLFSSILQLLRLVLLTRSNDRRR